MSKSTVMAKWFVLIFVCFAVSPVIAVHGTVQAKKEVNVLSKGAKGDGIFLNTKVLQKIIDELSGQGGGRLIFPEGIYHTGSLSMKPDITLHLEHGSVILGSINIKGLTMKNIQLKVWEKDFRPAFVFDDVDGLVLDKIDIHPTNQASQIILKDVRNPFISKVRIEGMQGDGVLKVK